MDAMVGRSAWNPDGGRPYRRSIERSFRYDYEANWAAAWFRSSLRVRIRF